jgi:ABC-type lipoprotein release transport system permease subunit
MAWRNIWRNPRRSLLTMAAIAFATLLLVFMLSWQFGSYETMINATVKIQTGHLQVQREGFRQRPDIRKVVRDPETVAALMAETRGVRAFSARAEAFSLVSSRERTYGVAVIGIEPAKEADVSTLQRIVRRGHYLADGDTAQALVGHLLAANLQVAPGDELVVLGQGRDGSIAATVVTVKGVFDSGQDEFDRSVLHLPLAYFQEVFSMAGSVHRLVALADSLEAVPHIEAALAEALKRRLPKNELVVVDWKELTPGLVEAIKMDLVSGFIFYIILIVVVAFSILNTFLMAIFERTREFGVMMAIGTSPARLTRLILLESIGLTALGVGAGIIAGCLVTSYFHVHGILIPGAEELARQFGLPERMYPRLSLLSVSVGAGIVLAITSVTALYPALKIRRLNPVQALAAA